MLLRNITIPLSKKEMKIQSGIWVQSSLDIGSETGRLRQEGGHINVSAGDRVQGSEQDI